MSVRVCARAYVCVCVCARVCDTFTSSYIIRVSLLMTSLYSHVARTHVPYSMQVSSN